MADGEVLDVTNIEAEVVFERWGERLFLKTKWRIQKKKYTKRLRTGKHLEIS